MVPLACLVLGLLAPPVPSPTPIPKTETPAPEAPVVTRHELRRGDRVLKYTVTTGMMPLTNEAGETEANMFFMAYVADRPGGPDKRPLMFSFNGGPGSSSVWLHLGALGPKRVRMLDDGALPPPPYELVDNEHTWLDQTDLVFIDPVGTGYSRATKPELGKKFWSVQGDIYILFLPTYAATAWYHKQVPADQQQRPLREFLDEVERWAAGDYTEALAKGDRLTPDERREVVQRLARYTGLDPAWLDATELRIEIGRFTKELLRDQKRTVGRLDSRLKGWDLLAATERPEFDPSMAAIRTPYTAMLNHYVRTALGYKTDLTYYILGGGIGPWDWGSAGAGYPDTSEALRSGFAKNPYMRLFVASGFYDLATPYFATEYTLSHMGLDPSLRGNISTAEYEAGHMMYIHAGELARLKKDVSGFLEKALMRR